MNPKVRGKRTCTEGAGAGTREKERGRKSERERVREREGKSLVLPKSQGSTSSFVSILTLPPPPLFGIFSDYSLKRERD